MRFSRENEPGSARFLHTRDAASMDAPVLADCMNLSRSRRSIELLKQEKTADMRPFDNISNPRQIRNRLSMNQQEFWARIGVTQSGGSRYESGREMPKPVRELLRLVHVEQIDLSQVKRVDFEIISYLKASHPDLYRSLRRAVKGRQPDAASGDPAEGEPTRPAGPIDLRLPAEEPTSNTP